MNKKSENIEIWKPVKGLEEFVEVSNLAKVRSLKTGNLMSSRASRGYLYCRLHYRKNGEVLLSVNKAVHRMVAETFLQNEENKVEVNHMDGNKLNNNLNNLEWVTRSENHLHAFRTGLRGKPKGNRKYSDEKIWEIREMRKQNMLTTEISKKTGIPISTIIHICLGTRR